MSSGRRCRYCQQIFQPSKYRPQQSVCSQADCQRQRRTDDHGERIRKDPAYAGDVRASQQKWRTANPEYWKRYRAQNPEAVERNRRQQQRRDQKRRLWNLAKNNLALDLKHDAAEVWLLGPGVADLAKNNLASAKVLIYQPVPASVRQ
jgi:hypothetical protein